MSSPIPRTSESDSRDARHSSVINLTIALALSGLLKVQRSCSQTYLAGLEAGPDDSTHYPDDVLAHLGAAGPDLAGTASRRPKQRPPSSLLAAMQPAGGPFRGLQGEDDVVCRHRRKHPRSVNLVVAVTMQGSVARSSGRRWKCVVGLSCRLRARRGGLIALTPTLGSAPDPSWAKSPRSTEAAGVTRERRCGAAAPVTTEQRVRCVDLFATDTSSSAAIAAPLARAWARQVRAPGGPPRKPW